MNGIVKNRADSIHEVSVLRRAYSLLRRSIRTQLQMPLWEEIKRAANAHQALCGVLLGCSFFIYSPAQAVVNVYFQPSTGTLQADFISATTNQFTATLAANPYFPNTFALTIKGKNSYTPPIISSPIADSTAVDRCMAHGFAWGMESERADSLMAIESMSVQVSSTSTCGGLFFSTSTYGGVIVSTSPKRTVNDIFLIGCSNGYAQVHSTITQRNGMDPPILP